MNDRKCAICPYMMDTKTFSSGDSTICIRGHIDCTTKNVVYGLFCEKCDTIVYVGETGNSLYERMSNHLSRIRNFRDDVVPLHFNSEDHDINCFRIVGIESIGGQSLQYRRVRENFWIKKLDTYHNGLNINYSEF